jgi:hypothetical protein
MVSCALSRIPVFGSTPELNIVDGSCSHVTAFGFADV